MSPRRDAVQNRAALVASGARLFADQGPAVPLAAVAADAGVSIATFYRHFPDRDALLMEVYRREIDQLGDVAELLENRTAAAAMTAWADRLVGYAETKQALADVVHAVPDHDRPSARDPILFALAAILAAGAADGTLRTDLDPEDVLGTFTGLWRLPPGPEWRARAHRLVGFVLEGLRRV